MSKFQRLAGLLTLAVVAAGDGKSLEPDEILDINRALWGADVGNAVKGISTVFSHKKQTIFHAGIMNQVMVSTPLSVGHPVLAVNLELDGKGVPIVVIDDARDRFFYVGKNTGKIRVVDLEKNELIARYDFPARSRRRGGRGKGEFRDNYPYKAAVLDPKTGALYVTNTSSGEVIAFAGGSLEVLARYQRPNTMDLDWDETENRLLALSAPSRREGSFCSFSPDSGEWTELKRFTGIPPRHVKANSKRIYLVARTIQAYSRDGAFLWEARTPAAPSAIFPFGDKVAVLYREGNPNAANSSVEILDSSGQRTARCEIGFEASHGFLDREGGRLFVGNGGGGSVSVISLEDGSEACRIDVANAAEQVALDRQTGRRFVLNRLGGSEIYVWEKDSAELVRLEAGGWPVDMALDVRGRTLWVLSHFEAALYPIDVDKLKVGAAIPLGVDGCRTDMISDLAADFDAGLIACAFPERERVAVFSVEKRSVIAQWRPSAFTIRRESKGPGYVQVAVDGKRRRIIAGSGKSNTLLAFSVDEGREVASCQVSRGISQRASYSCDNLFIDDDTLYAGPHIIRLDDFSVQGNLREVHKIIGRSDEKLYGVVTRGAGEYLVRLDPESGRSEASFYLFDSEVRNAFFLDDGVLLTADLQRARVCSYSLR